MIGTAFDLSCVAFEEMAPQFIFSSHCVWQGWIDSELLYILKETKMSSVFIASLQVCKLIQNHCPGAETANKIRVQTFPVTSVSAYFSFRPILDPALILLCLQVSCWERSSFASKYGPNICHFLSSCSGKLDKKKQKNPSNPMVVCQS